MSEPKKNPRVDPGFITRTWFAALLLVAVVIGVYWPVLHFDFINFDDPVYITANPHVRAGLTWGGFTWAFRARLLGNWHPVTWLSFMLDSQLFKGWAGGYHLTNLVLHAANTILLFVLLRRLTQAHWRSALVAALFALHPLHVESVAWIAERKDVLSTFFGLLALLCYGRYAQGKTSNTQHPTPNIQGWYGLGLCCFVLSLMSKPMFVTLPFLLLLLDYWPLQRFQLSAFSFRLFPRLVAEKFPFFALSAIFSAIALWAQKTSGAVISLTYLPFAVRLENALVSYVRYLGNTFWPTGLALPYLEHLPPPWMAGAAFLLVGLLSMVAVCLARRRPYFIVGWFWYLGVLVPVLGLVQVGTQAMADRYTYVPLIGVFLILVWGLGELLTRWRMSPALIGVMALAVLGLFTARTADQLRYWRNSESLFRHAVAVTQRNYVAYTCLACDLRDQGRTGEAIACFQQALQIIPQYPNANSDLGALLLRQGRFEEAAAHLQVAIQSWPDDSEVLNLLGIALAKQEKPEAAAGYFQRALSDNPEDPNIAYNLGKAWLDQGHDLEAIPNFRQALKNAPDDPATHDKLGIALARQGQREEAIAEFKEAVRLKPDYEEAKEQLRQVESR